jgi:hypothetical protein
MFSRSCALSLSLCRVYNLLFYKKKKKGCWCTNARHRGRVVHETTHRRDQGAAVWISRGRVCIGQIGVLIVKCAREKTERSCIGHGL